ncbi:MAG: VCBS repeat-containing protein, partial [Myxococcota bacterium]|nr:VCBS repeat-containing protein [Myxococcota bacterium]
MARQVYPLSLSALLLTLTLPVAAYATPVPDGCAPLNAGTSTADNSGSITVAARLGDWDQDGAQDIAWLHQGGNEVEIWFNDGSGAFPLADRRIVNVGSVGAGLALGDVDGDGFTDIAVADTANNEVRIYLGDGLRSFSGLN